MVLLKAKVCITLSMVCSRFLTRAGKTGISIKEEGPHLGAESRNKGPSQVNFQTQYYVHVGIGHKI